MRFSFIKCMIKHVLIIVTINNDKREQLNLASIECIFCFCFHAIPDYCSISH